MKAEPQGGIRTLRRRVALPAVAQSESKQMSPDGHTDEPHVVDTYAGVLFSLEKEGNSARATTWLSLEDVTLSEISQ